MSKSGQNPDKSGQGHMRQAAGRLPSSRETVIFSKSAPDAEIDEIRTNSDTGTRINHRRRIRTITGCLRAGIRHQSTPPEYKVIKRT